MLGILHIEDDASDADLVAAKLRSGGLACDIIVVATRESFEQQLGGEPFDVILADDSLPAFDGVSALAQLPGAERLSAGQGECVQQISHGRHHLLDLINEVLDIARIETGRLSLTPEPVLVEEIIPHAADPIAPLARERHITLVVETAATPDRSVLANRQRLNQMHNVLQVIDRLLAGRRQVSGRGVSAS